MLEDFVKDKNIFINAGFTGDLKQIYYSYKWPLTLRVYGNSNCAKSGESFLNILIIEAVTKIKGEIKVAWYLGTYERNSVNEGPGIYIPEFMKKRKEFTKEEYAVEPHLLEEKLRTVLSEFSQKHSA